MLNINKEQFNEYKKSKKVFPVILEVNGDEITPINMFYSLTGKNKCLLESACNIDEGGRYSFACEDPYMQLKSDGTEISIIKNDGTVIKEKSDVLNAIKNTLNVEYSPLGFELPFYGGGIGYIGYDVIRQYEVLPDNNEREIDIPEASLLYYKNVFCYDHYRHSLYIIYNANLDENEEFEDIVEILNKQYDKIKNNYSYHPLPGPTENKMVKSNYTEEEFCALVDEAKEHIKAGDIFQVVLSQRLSIKTDADPFDVYRRLRSKNPSPYLFYIEFDGFKVVGSSPESLVSVSGKTVTTNPIAGTRPRGKTAEEDEMLKQDLLKDEKEIAEHMMLVDLGRNDIGKISEFGTVKVDRFMEVDLYSHVMHIVSTVNGTLKEGLDCYDAIKACLPAGTVSGAPKIRSMEIIDELENVRRGLYAGALGYFSYHGNMDVCIAIRTLVFKDETAYVQAGAGIVYDSEPHTEYLETLNKAGALKEVI